MSVASSLHAQGWFRAAALSLRGPVRRPFRAFWQWWLRRSVLHRPLPHPGTRHGLDGELIVSLTSYPARYAILPVTLRSLLTQSVKADRVVLWLAHDHVAELPAGILELRQFGLEIRACDDIRSFKKLVPTVEAFPDAFIVTADDDLYYPPDWLEILVKGVEPTTHTIACRRVVRPVLTESGDLAPFNDWEWDVDDEASRSPSQTNMLESGAGALFPPGSLHPILSDRSLFLELCPTADDLWFNVCAQLAGSCRKKVGGRLWITSWSGSQASSLWEDNVAGGNDRMIEALRARLGRDLFLPTAVSSYRRDAGQPIEALP